jgi:predicted O-methyltransferase YrrM
MYSPLQLAFKYLRYYFTSSNGKGHGIHSPYVFDFVTNILNDKRKQDVFDKIEAKRTEFLNNKTIVEVEDFGAGSVNGLVKKRTVQQIAATSLKSRKYAQLLYRMVHYFQPNTVLELGTSLGITTVYLATAKKNAQVITLEGSTAVAAIAREHFNQLQLQNIQLIAGNFDETLAPAIENNAMIDFAFIDGNHRKEPTLRYFEQLHNHATENAVFVFDDIHWSREMEEAWATIQAHPSVTLSIDLFFIGLVFFRKEQIEKQHFTIRF